MRSSSRRRMSGSEYQLYGSVCSIEKAAYARRATTEPMSRLSSVADFAGRHRRWLAVLQIAPLAVFFGLLGWALRGSLQAAKHDLEDANIALFGAACAALG